MSTSGTPSLRQRGISLIELIMFIVIISSAMAGILMVMDRVTGHSADPLVRKQALAVAESMLEEIQLQDLSGVACVGTLVQNAVRTGATSVCDYKDYSTSGGVKEFSATNGVVPGLESYDIASVVITRIADMAPPTLGGTAIAPGSGVMIAVTVTSPGDTVTATGYRVGN
jgi:MSHA pilin protein MshD